MAAPIGIITIVLQLWLSLAFLPLKLQAACFSSLFPTVILLILCSLLSFLVEYIHKCRQAFRGCRAVGSDWGMWSWRDLQSSPASGSADSGLCPESGTEETSLGHVCLLPHSHQRGKMHVIEFLYIAEWCNKLTQCTKWKLRGHKQDAFIAQGVCQIPALFDVDAWDLTAVKRRNVLKTFLCMIWNNSIVRHYSKNRPNRG